MNFKVILSLLKLKVLITLFCSICLIYQTYLIIEQYLKYNSIINIKFTRNIIDTLPAITICYNKLYSFEKLSKRYNEKVFENYVGFLKNASSGRMKKEEMSDGNEYYSREHQFLYRSYKFSK